MATELMGFEIGATSAWLVWILPFAAALIIPGIAKPPKLHSCTEELIYRRCLDKFPVQ
jgi:hypothetical protein